MTQPALFRTALALAASTVLLAACGGGGSEPVAEATAPTTAPTTAAVPVSAAASDAATGGTATTAPTAPATTTPPVVAATTASTTDGSCGFADFQAEMLRLVNAARSAGQNCRTRGAFAATTELGWNARLATAALGHSADMAAQNYFDHTSRDGRSFVQRIEATGYDWRRLGENIAAGQDSVAEVVAGWLSSDSHCANLMDPNLREVAVACMPGATGARYSHYWTMDLGTSR